MTQPSLESYPGPLRKRPGLMVVSAPLIWLLFRGAKGGGISRRWELRKLMTCKRKVEVGTNWEKEVNQLEVRKRERGVEWLRTKYNATCT